MNDLISRQDAIDACLNGFCACVSDCVDEIEKLPSAKQIKYAQYLAQRMCQDLPKEYTKQAYSDFISKWKPVVQHEDMGMNEPNAWQMQYM